MADTRETITSEGVPRSDKPVKPDAPPEIRWMQLLFPIAIFFAIFYFLLIRPQKKQDQKKREMLDSLRKDDKIITVGGVFGNVMNIAGDEITL